MGSLSSFLVPRSHAQDLPQAVAPLSFEVASIKMASQPWFEVAPKRSGGRFSWTTDLWHLIGYAYGIQLFRISGPIPGSDSIYRVEASTTSDATDEQIRLTKEVDGYILSIAKGGFKLKEARAEAQPELIVSRENR